MKFGKHLQESVAPAYGPEAYLNYDLLKRIIRDLSLSARNRADLVSRQVSLTTTARTNAQGLVQSNEEKTENEFFRVLEEEMEKLESFTLQKVTALRHRLLSVETSLEEREQQRQSDEKAKINDGNSDASDNKSNKSGNSGKSESGSEGDNSDASSNEELSAMADGIADDFLQLEQYVNINFMAVHKILKKHDKWLPENPCKGIYVSRMQAQAWIRGDYSDVVVRLSRIYSIIRENRIRKHGSLSDSEDSFSKHQKVRATKYWVKTEDVSRVKYTILRHLPLLAKKQASSGEYTDSQLTSSVYLDNNQLEMYRRRLNRVSGSSTLRLLWHDTGDPKTFSVERKTYLNKRKGEESIKDRFDIHELEMGQIVSNTYPFESKKQELLESGKSEREVRDWERLVKEIAQVVTSKVLTPTIRTQYMRTIFQQLEDETAAAVRICLDTNFCMISERGYDLKQMKVWHRAPQWKLKSNEIHRFPHAVLNLELLGDGNNLAPPDWFNELKQSGLLYECPCFSKYVHGCAVLLNEDVQAVPYWVDTPSLQQSIKASGASRILMELDNSVSGGSDFVTMVKVGNAVRRGNKSNISKTTTNTTTKDNVDKTRKKNIKEQRSDDSVTLAVDEESNFLNDFEANKNQKSTIRNINDENDTINDGYCAYITWLCPCFLRGDSYKRFEMVVASTNRQLIEPKIFMANERTFLHWLTNAVFLSSIGSSVLAFSDDSGKSWGLYYAIALLAISMAIIIYAVHILNWRGRMIRTRVPAPWDDPRGPLLLGCAIAIVLLVNFCMTCYELHDYFQNEKEFAESMLFKLSYKLK